MHDEVWMESNNFHGLLHVTKGSCEKPSLAMLSYCGNKSNIIDPMALVGQGQIYDNSGLCLDEPKSSFHKIGAVTAVGVMYSVSKLSMSVNVYAFLLLFKYVMSGRSMKSEDCVRLRNGEIIRMENAQHTNRLVMADYLSYVSSIIKTVSIYNSCSFARSSFETDLAELATPMLSCSKSIIRASRTTEMPPIRNDNDLQREHKTRHRYCSRGGLHLWRS